jgi:predicted alpha-1,6-mannanase (GH76 family)
MKRQTKTMTKISLLLGILAFLTAGASSCDDPQVTDPVPVDDYIAVTGISLDHQEITLEIDKEKTLLATIVPDNASNKTVWWLVDKPAVVGVENGKLTAKTEGKAIITVATQDGNFKAACTVTVPPIPPVAVTGVTMKQKEVTLRIGQTALPLLYSVAPANAANKGVTWLSDKNDVAEVDDIGQVTAVAEGTAKITVTTEDGGFDDFCDVTVSPPDPYWNPVADTCSRSLITNFWNTAENFFREGGNGTTISQRFEYWPQAHALDVLVDAYIRTENNFYSDYFEKWRSGVRAKNGNTFFNNYIDDMEWNALAMLRVNQVTNDQNWLNDCQNVWADIKNNWKTNTFDGGFLWHKSAVSKHACSNAPAAILAARLYRQHGDEANKNWALNIYDWQRKWLFDANTGAVFDNIREGGLDRTTYTYNQGTFIGAAVELYLITGNQSYISDAVKAADYTMNSKTENDDKMLLRGSDAGDGALFNGIFIRYLTQLVLCGRLNESDRIKYINFIRYNGETLWDKGTYRITKQILLFGTSWRTKPTVSTAASANLKANASGGMLIEALALLEREKKLF